MSGFEILRNEALDFIDALVRCESDISETCVVPLVCMGYFFSDVPMIWIFVLFVR